MSRSPSPSSPPSPPSPSRPVPPNRAGRLRDGLGGIAKALWFLVSIVLYALGMIVLTAGNALIRLSGWGAAKKDSDPAKSKTKRAP